MGRFVVPPEEEGGPAATLPAPEPVQPAKPKAPKRTRREKFTPQDVQATAGYAKILW